MTSQFTFFEGSSSELPEGAQYRSQLISEREQTALLHRVRELPFKEFEFHGFKGKRRTVSFGWQYEFSGRGQLKKAQDIPDYLLSLRAVAAKFAQLEAESLQHVLVIEYGPGSGIGWHRDRPVFGEVVGISLLAPCLLRFRRQVQPSLSTQKTGVNQSDLRSTLIAQHSRRAKGGSHRVVPPRATWERFNLTAEPRSAYHLTGPARWEWQHSILRVETLRYSITFRTMSEE